MRKELIPLKVKKKFRRKVKKKLRRKVKEEESTKKRKLGIRKKMKSRKRRSNGQKRFFSTLMSVLSIFDREDLNAVYQLVMDRFQDEMPEARIGDCRVRIAIVLQEYTHSTMALELIRFVKKILAELELKS
ncbi:hypothetical protein Tco_0884273 [Tanacetum coccineum]